MQGRDLALGCSPWPQLFSHMPAWLASKARSETLAVISTGLVDLKRLR